MRMGVQVSVDFARKQQEVAPEPAATPEDIQLLREIRDELKKQG